MNGSIKFNAKTQHHPASLDALGYKGRLEGSTILVEVEGFESKLDLTDGSDALIELIRGRKALTYASRIILPGGVQKKGMNVFSMMALNAGPLNKALRERLHAELGIDPSKRIDFTCLIQNNPEKASSARAETALPEGWR